MQAHPSGCSGCPLDKIGKGFTDVEGSGRNGLLILGEASGESEAVHSLPFRPYAQAGAILERGLMSLAIDRKDCVVTNIIRCQPVNNVLVGAPYEIPAITACSGYLNNVVQEFSPRVILCLGNTPLRAVTGLFGEKRTVTHLRGYVLWSSRFQLPVVATYHPAFLARGKKNLLGVFYQDIYKALSIARGDVVAGVDYYINPRSAYQRDYKIWDHNVWPPSFEELGILPSDTISFDIETDYSEAVDEDDLRVEGTRITQFQYSTGKGNARVFEWADGPTKDLIRKIMATPNKKISWNGWRFDEPILNDNGIHIAGEHHDLMNMYHHWNPDIPANLQYAASLFNFPFPWKDLAGEDLSFYGACDVDALHWIYEPLVNVMKGEGIYGSDN